MFQFAMVEKLKNNGVDVKVDLSHFQNDIRQYSLSIFPNLQIEEVDRRKNIFLLRGFLGKSYRKILQLVGIYKIEREELICDERLLDVKSGVISGYYQNEKYFDDIREVVREKFTFPKNNPRLESVVEKIRNNSNCVSIHIRRGDYVQLSSLYGGICDMEYYTNAIEYVNGKMDPHFIIISDDIEWVKENFTFKDAEFITKDMFDDYQDWYDMYIMSQCHHNIIANSTFSWWGAWLNSYKDKMVICPSKWNNKYPHKSPACEGWIVIGKN